MKIMLDEGAVLPTRAHSTDAGLDLYAREAQVVPARESAKFDTGVHIELPPNTVGFLKSKSGLNVKHGITSEGVIDEGYTGSIVVKLYNNTGTDYHVAKGDKISQLVILPIEKPKLELVDALGETERGNNGFGSTGKNASDADKELEEKISFLVGVIDEAIQRKKTCPIQVGDIVVVMNNGLNYRAYGEWVENHVDEYQDIVPYARGQYLPNGTIGSVIAVHEHIILKERVLAYISVNRKGYLIDVDGLEKIRFGKG